jgi:hypothetical protein
MKNLESARRFLRFWSSNLWCIEAALRPEINFGRPMHASTSAGCGLRGWPTAKLD